MVAVLIVFSIVFAIVAVIGITAACILKRKELENIIVVERITAEEMINAKSKNDLAEEEELTPQSFPLRNEVSSPDRRKDNILQAHVSKTLT